ncbi:MAG: YraN family protein [Pseudomonadota bacterium]
MPRTPIEIPGSQLIEATTFPARRRIHRGRTSYLKGLAAEKSAEQLYQQKGAKILGRRVRTPYGELDLVAEQDGVLIFVEVKAQQRQSGWDSPVSDQQWRRLKNAANHYMISILSETGVQPSCRFDVAVMDRIGKLSIYENACGFDEH